MTRVRNKVQQAAKERRKGASAQGNDREMKKRKEFQEESKGPTVLNSR